MLEINTIKNRSDFSLRPGWCANPVISDL